MPNMLQVFPERPAVIETFRYMRPFERDALIEEASAKEISPAELKTNQTTVTRSTVEHFVAHPEEINKPQNTWSRSDTEQLLPLVCQTSDGYWLYDGNHRANAAMKLDMMLECKIVDLRPYEDDGGEHTAAGPVKIEGDRYGDFQFKVEYSWHEYGDEVEDGDWNAITVVAFDTTQKGKTEDGKYAGSVDFVIRDGHLESANTEVYPEYQRKGLATAMYVYAENEVGMKAVPNRDRTDAGYALWRQKDRPFGMSWAAKVAKQYGPVYHGTYREWSDKIQIDQYKIGKFFTTDPLVAQAYGSFVYECYLTMNKPFIVDAEGSGYSSIPTPKKLKGWVAEGMDEVDTDIIAKYAYENGYDGAIIKNVYELHHQSLADDYIVFKSNQVKQKGIVEPEIDPYTANKYHKQELQRRWKRDHPEYEEKTSAYNKFEDAGLLDKSNMRKWRRWWEARGHDTRVEKVHGGLWRCYLKLNKTAAAPGRALKLYHVTTVPIAKEIKANGFKPVDQGMWKNYYAPQGRDGIYFYDDLKYSEAYAAYAEGQLFTRNMDPDKPWSENKKTIPQMAIIEVQVPEDAVITTDQKEDGYFVSSANLNKIKIKGIFKYDYIPTQGRGIGEKVGTVIHRANKDFTNFPVGEKIDSWSVLQYVREMHEGYEDDGRITQYEWFVLKEVPLASIDAPWETGQDTVDQYARLTTEPPPIVLDHHNIVIDGTHRVAVATDRGDTTIKAFVPEGDAESFPDEEEESLNALRGLQAAVSAKYDGNWTTGLVRMNPDIYYTAIVDVNKVHPWQAYRSRKVIAEYVQKMEAGKPIDAIEVTKTHNPGHYRVGHNLGGHHRLAAVKKMGWKKILVQVHREGNEYMEHMQKKYGDDWEYVADPSKRQREEDAAAQAKKKQDAQKKWEQENPWANEPVAPSS